MAWIRGLWLLSALLLAPLVAAQPGFIVVVPHEGSPMDVVAGANFAAHIQATQSARFTGSTDAELYANLDDDALAERTLVFIDGDRVEVLVGEATPGFHQEVAAEAVRYFERLGFSARLLDGTASEFQERRVPRPQALPEPAPVEAPLPDCDGCFTAQGCIPVGGIIGEEACMPDGSFRLRKADGAPCAVAYECLAGSCAAGVCGVPAPPPERSPQVTEEPPEKTGVITRIIGWFSRLFR